MILTSLNIPNKRGRDKRRLGNTGGWSLVASSFMRLIINEKILIVVSFNLAKLQMY